MIDGNNAIHAIPELLEELAVDRNQARDSLPSYPWLDSGLPQVLQELSLIHI